MEVSEYKDVESRYVHMSGRMPGMCQGFGLEIVGSVTHCHLCCYREGVRAEYSDSICMPGMCEVFGLEIVGNPNLASKTEGKSIKHRSKNWSIL